MGKLYQRCRWHLRRFGERNEVFIDEISRWLLQLSSWGKVCNNVKKDSECTFPWTVHGVSHFAKIKRWYFSFGHFLLFSKNKTKKLQLLGVTTLTNAVSGQRQNCSGILEISPGIGTLGNFSGKHAIIPGHCRKNLRIYVGNFREGNPKIREDDPNSVVLKQRLLELSLPVPIVLHFGGLSWLQFFCSFIGVKHFSERCFMLKKLYCPNKTLFQLFSDSVHVKPEQKSELYYGFIISAILTIVGASCFKNLIKRSYYKRIC